MAFLRGLVVLSIAFLGACEPPPLSIDTSATPLHLVAVVDVSSGEGLVALTRYRGNTSISQVIPNYSADFSISGEQHGANQTDCGPAVAGSCRHAYLPVLPAGGSVELRVILDDGTTVNGHAELPSAPTVSFHRHRVEVSLLPNAVLTPRVTLPIAWTAAVGHGVQIMLAVTAVYLPGRVVTDAQCRLFPDPASTTLYQLRDSIQLSFGHLPCAGVADAMPWDSASVQINVIALNRSIFAYKSAVIAGQDVLSTHARYGISALTGMFGAVATTRENVMLVSRR